LPNYGKRKERRRPWKNIAEFLVEIFVELFVEKFDEKDKLLTTRPLALEEPNTKVIFISYNTTGKRKRNQILVVFNTYNSRIWMILLSTRSIA
jgi:hypothetical protein